MLLEMLLFLFAVATLDLPLHVLALEDASLSEEMRCLVSPPTYCNMGLKYHGIGEVRCNQLLEVAKSKIELLYDPPILETDEKLGHRWRGVLLMFDPDAPVTQNPKDGYLHWMAYVKWNHRSKQLEVIEPELKAYYPPTPPPNTGAHRYQVFVFTKPVGNLAHMRHIKEKRKFRLCPFMEANNLQQPLFTFQFQYADQTARPDISKEI